MLLSVKFLGTNFQYPLFNNFAHSWGLGSELESLFLVVEFSIGIGIIRSQLNWCSRFSIVSVMDNVFSLF